MRVRLPLLIEREKLEPPPALHANRPKVAFVESEHVRDTVAPGEDYDGGVGNSNVQILVLPDHLGCLGNVGCAEGFEAISAADHFLQERRLRVPAYVAQEKVVELSEHERRKQ